MGYDLNRVMTRDDKKQSPTQSEKRKQEEVEAQTEVKVRGKIHDWFQPYFLLLTRPKICKARLEKLSLERGRNKLNRAYTDARDLVMS